MKLDERKVFMKGRRYRVFRELPNGKRGGQKRACSMYMLQFSSVQSLSRVQLSATPWTTACQASLSITNSRSVPKLMSIESVMPATISSSVVPFSSCPQYFPASGSFPMSQPFASGGPSIGVSASISVQMCLRRASFFPQRSGIGNSRHEILFLREIILCRQASWIVLNNFKT